MENEQSGTLFGSTAIAPVFPREGTQYAKLLKALLDAEGGWVNKQYFVRDLYLTQAGHVLHVLENKFHWPIEHSTFTDEFGFKSYRITAGPRARAVVQI